MFAPNESKASHFLYFPSEDLARSAARDIAGRGLKYELRLGADEVNWLVLVQQEWPVRDGEFDQVVETLKAITATHSGEYDGWEILANE